MKLSEELRNKQSRDNRALLDRAANRIDELEKGYRKPIKAQWKWGRPHGQYGIWCTNCDAGFTGENAEWIAREHDYCPKCGAYMKGGAE